MSGTEEAEFKLLRINFPHFYIHPDYAEYKKEQLFYKLETEWAVICDFKIENVSPEWYDLVVTATIVLMLKNDSLKISELTAETTFHIQNGGSFAMKYEFLRMAVNQTLSHAQGGWKVKNRNVEVSSKLPQAYDKLNDVELVLKKKLYEIWE